MRDGIQLSEAITGDGAAIFRHACWMDLEGIVSKRIGSRYVSGRTRAWLKTKNPNFERSRLRNPGTYNVASRVRLLTVLAVVGLMGGVSLSMAQLANAAKTATSFRLTFRGCCPLTING